LLQTSLTTTSPTPCRLLVLLIDLLLILVVLVLVVGLPNITRRMLHDTSTITSLQYLLDPLAPPPAGTNLNHAFIHSSFDSFIHSFHPNIRTWCLLSLSY
jgi:hypothetical protein